MNWIMIRSLFRHRIVKLFCTFLAVSSLILIRDQLEAEHQHMAYLLNERESQQLVYNKRRQQLEAKLGNPNNKLKESDRKLDQNYLNYVRWASKQNGRLIRTIQKKGVHYFTDKNNRIDFEKTRLELYILNAEEMSMNQKSVTEVFLNHQIIKTIISHFFPFDVDALPLYQNKDMDFQSKAKQWYIANMVVVKAQLNLYERTLEGKDENAVDTFIRLDKVISGSFYSINTVQIFLMIVICVVGWWHRQQGGQRLLETQAFSEKQWLRINRCSWVLFTLIVVGLTILVMYGILTGLNGFGGFDILRPIEWQRLLDLSQRWEVNDFVLMGYIVPDQLTSLSQVAEIPLWVVLLLASLLRLVQFYFYICIGCWLACLPKRKSIAFLILSLFILLHVTEFFPYLNPFSVKGGLSVAMGAGTLSYLYSLILLIIAIVVGKWIASLFMKKDRMNV